MESSDHEVVAIEVERIAYASIGRHLRVMCFLCLLLLVVGFLIGHLVANQHSRNLARDIQQREESLQDQLARLGDEVDALRKAQSSGQLQVAELQSQVARHELAVTETRKEAESSEGLRRSLIVEAIEQGESDRRGLMRELRSYQDQSQSLPADTAASAMSRVLDAQRSRLNRLIDGPAKGACLTDSNSTLPLVPVSESGPSPTIAPVAAAAVPPIHSGAPGETIVLFESTGPEPAISTPPPPPAVAPPPPPETPFVSRAPAALPPAPVPAAAPPAPVAAFVPAVVAPAPAPAPAPLPATAAAPMVPETATAEIDSVDLKTLEHASGTIPEAKRNRASLFFSPTRRTPPNSVQAIPILAAPQPQAAGRPTGARY